MRVTLIALDGGQHKYQGGRGTAIQLEWCEDKTEERIERSEKGGEKGEGIREGTPGSP